jgi:hypothetical protein
MSDARRKALSVLAAVAVVMGIACAINGLSHPFAADAGQQLGGLFAMNTFGGILTAGLGLVTILGTRDDQPKVVLGAGGVFLLGAFITLLRTATTLNILGGHGATMSFLLMMGVGLIALVVSPDTGGIGARED